MTNTFMKKIAILLTAATMSISQLPAMVYANDGMGIDTMKNVTVQDMHTYKNVQNESGANVRTAPSTEYPVIKKLNDHASVEVTGRTSNGWYQVMVSLPEGGESSGYISGNLLGDEQAISDNAITSGKEMTVEGTSNYLALRTEPSYESSNEIGELNNGEKVIVESYAGNYAYVYAPSLGQYGYVNANFLA